MTPNVCGHYAAPHSTLFMIECGVERVQLIVPSQNESSVIVPAVRRSRARLTSE